MATLIKRCVWVHKVMLVWGSPLPSPATAACEPGQVCRALMTTKGHAFRNTREKTLGHMTHEEYKLGPPALQPCPGSLSI